MRILLVEDDDATAAILEKGFTSEYYAVDVAKDGQMGWQLVNAFDYDLIVLDVVLPKLDGIQFCQRLRESCYQMPVLMVTALDSSTRKIAGLDAGADDYITKPFELDELMARVRVLLRRAQVPNLSMLVWGDLLLNPNTREVTYENRILNLTPKEYRLLELFLRKQSQVFSRSAILDSLWNCGETPGEDTVTAHIKGLRRKLTEAGAPADLITTVYGVGYRLKPLTKASDQSTSVSQQTSSSGNRAACPLPNCPNSAVATTDRKALPQQQTKVALQSLWLKVEAQQRERLATLNQAIEALATQQISPDLCHQAHQAAHSLKGALGIFGLSRGSELAQRLEHQLADPCSAQPKNLTQIKKWVMALEQEIANGPSLADLSATQPTLPMLVIMDDCAQLSQSLAQTAKAQGLTVQVIQTDQHWQIFRQQLPTAYRRQSVLLSHPSASEPDNFSNSWPDLGIVNLSLQNADQTRLVELSDLMVQIPTLPVMVCSTDGSLSSRIRAARLGPSTFLHNPDVAQILSRGVELRSQPYPNAAKVLIVDDDPHIPEALQTLLKPWGLNLTTLDHPLKFWSILHKIAPDLLVLDIEMPEFNGLDLCRVVRQTPLWDHLPIVFLTAHVNVPNKHSAMLAGANDIIDKSLNNSDLIKRLLKQLKPSPLPAPQGCDLSQHQASCP